MRSGLFLICASVFALSSVPAYAGGEVLEGKAPVWVREADLGSIDVAKSPAEVISDSQYRLEGGTVTEYQDSAVRIDNAATLMEQNTVSLEWMPDKGDLTVHRLQIYRAGEFIDLLAEGAKFDVIRREQGLENRLLDGALTATLSIPGLRVGDILRTSYSVTVRDQALGDEMQVLQYLGSDPWRVGMGRAIVSWPDGEEIYWKAEDPARLGEAELRDGYRYLTVDLPLPEGKDMPNDAPARYQRPTVLRVGSFTDWAELSRVMAPHFAVAAEVSPGDDVAAQAAAIMKQASSPLERAQLATRLVQDKVSYLLDGLDGGNYLPQQAEFTWEKRYGDCKAKTVLLLALLTEMGIEAEPALVVSRGGDALPELLPLPGDFDHVIAHAVIDGSDYWFDGTSSGSRLYNIADVPGFHYALPLRESGADLVPMIQRNKTYPDIKITGVVDHSAGIDLPQTFTITTEGSGPFGARMEEMADAGDKELLRRLAGSFASSSGIDGSVISSISLDYDKDAALGRIVIEGLASSDFEWSDGKFVTRENRNGALLFNPNRARREWRDIPVATQGPAYAVTDVALILPDGGRGFAIEGEPAIDDRFAHTRIVVETTLSGDRLRSVSQVWQELGEVAPGDVAAAKRDALRINTMLPELVAPDSVGWRWTLDEGQRRRKAAPILETYDKAIAFARDDDFGPLIAKAMFLNDMYLFDDALDAYDELIEKSPSAWAYLARSSVLLALGRRGDAIADIREAYDLDPSNDTAFSLARELAYAGKTGEALDLLADLPVPDEDEVGYADAWATVSGLSGDTGAALASLSEEVAKRPESSQILNAECWFRGLFNVQLGDAVSGCTRAIERAENPAPALDSRAMVQFRLGNYEAALADLDAVLKLAPWISNSRYLRGVVRLEKGDKAGQEDIETALRMAPELKEFYAVHGIAPAS